MNAKELANKLNGREYRSEITKEEIEAASKAGLLVVFGYSDDLVKLRGAVNDEVGAYDGTTFQVCALGLVRKWTDFLETEPSEEDAIKYFEMKRSQSVITIVAKWGGDPVWVIEANVEFAEFTIVEDGEPFCRGIVVSL